MKARTPLERLLMEKVLDAERRVINAQNRNLEYMSEFENEMCIRASQRVRKQTAVFEDLMRQALRRAANAEQRAADAEKRAADAESRLRKPGRLCGLLK